MSISIDAIQSSVRIAFFFEIGPTLNKRIWRSFLNGVYWNSGRDSKAKRGFSVARGPLVCEESL